MANYEKPTVQFRPRNKAEARQWRRDRAQLRYERNWKRTSKTHNPLTGKKNYSAPKAEIYQSKDLQKSQTQYRKGNRSYRPTPRFGSVVMGAVSLLLLIGLVAVSFVAYSNSMQSDFSQKVWFSPSAYLDGLSSVEVIIPPDVYEVRRKMQFSLVGGGAVWRGYVTVGGKTVKSEYWLTIEDLTIGSQYEFYIDGNIYKTATVGGLGSIDRVLPITTEIVYDINTMPDLNIVADAWRDVGSWENFWNALSVTGGWIGDSLAYQWGLLLKLFPWNVTVSYSDSFSDGVSIDIPWRDSDNNIISQN